MAGIVELVDTLHPGKHFKPAHIQSSVKSLEEKGVLETFLINRVRITPLGQEVLTMLPVDRLTVLNGECSECSVS